MNRRHFLGIGAMIGGGALVWFQRNELLRTMVLARSNDGVKMSDALPPEGDICMLTPEQAEGPFFISAPVRRDIKEDRTGLPLELKLQIVRADGCTPVKDALVEVWHCDAAGRYSAYREDRTRAPFDTILLAGSLDPNAHAEPANGKTFLRGAQVSDSQGMVSFSTILPGWYEPRVPHIHVKVIVDRMDQLTTQLYFPKKLTDRVYQRHADYAPHGACSYSFANDLVLRRYPDASGLVLQPTETGDGLVATARLGIA